MKKIVLIFSFMCLFCFSVKAEEIIKKDVIIFSQPCFYCEKLKKYIADNKIEEKYKNVNFKILDIQDRYNRALLNKYARQYGISGNNIGLPLTFIGDHYIMGWSEEYADEFNQYIEDLTKQDNKK